MNNTRKINYQYDFADFMAKNPTISTNEINIYLSVDCQLQCCFFAEAAGLWIARRSSRLPVKPTNCELCSFLKTKNTYSNSEVACCCEAQRNNVQANWQVDNFKMQIVSARRK